MSAAALCALLIAAFVVFLNPTIVAPFDGTPFLKLGETIRRAHSARHVMACRMSTARRDADVAFGLAYAHAEDDFKTIQQSLMTSRGRLALVDNQTPRLLNGLTRAVGLGEWFEVTGADPAVTDYLVQLLKVRERVDGQYKSEIASGGISQGAHECSAPMRRASISMRRSIPIRSCAGFRAVERAGYRRRVRVFHAVVLRA